MIEVFSNKYGPKWYKSRLPRDVYEKYINGLEYEKSIKWNELIPHHPIYYLDFPHLQKIIEKVDNWREFFQNIFGTKKEIICGPLIEIEYIRNKIAHNRKTSERELDIVNSLCEKLKTFLGEERFVELVQKCTKAEDIGGQLKNLYNELVSVFGNCIKMEKINGVPFWNEINKQWWFDETYLS